MVRGPNSPVPINTKTVHVHGSLIDTGTVRIHENPTDIGNVHNHGSMKEGVRIHQKSNGPEIRPWML